MDGHMGVASSSALALAGIDAATPDPEGGMVDRDALGQPTGVLRWGGGASRQGGLRCASPYIWVAAVCSRSKPLQ